MSYFFSCGVIDRLLQEESEDLSNVGPVTVEATLTEAVIRSQRVEVKKEM